MFYVNNRRLFEDTFKIALCLTPSYIVQWILDAEDAEEFRTRVSESERCMCTQPNSVSINAKEGIKHIRSSSLIHERLRSIFLSDDPSKISFVSMRNYSSKITAHDCVEVYRDMINLKFHDFSQQNYFSCLYCIGKLTTLVEQCGTIIAQAVKEGRMEQHDASAFSRDVLDQGVLALESSYQCTIMVDDGHFRNIMPIDLLRLYKRPSMGYFMILHRVKMIYGEEKFNELVDVIKLHHRLSSMGRGSFDSKRMDELLPMVMICKASNDYDDAWSRYLDFSSAILLRHKREDNEKEFFSRAAF